MQLSEVWTDAYGGAQALYAGTAGGRRLAVACTPRQAGAAARALARLGGPGEVLLLVVDGPTALRAALAVQADPLAGRPIAGVLVPGGDLSGGPALTLPETRREHQGFAYLDGGPLPGWGEPGGAQGESLPASVAASLSLPVRCCPPERLEAALREWR